MLKTKAGVLLPPTGEGDCRGLAETKRAAPAILWGDNQSVVTAPANGSAFKHLLSSLSWFSLLLDFQLLFTHSPPIPLSVPSF